MSNEWNEISPDTPETLPLPYAAYCIDGGWSSNESVLYTSVTYRTPFQCFWRNTRRWSTSLPFLVHHRPRHDRGRRRLTQKIWSCMGHRYNPGKRLYSNYYTATMVAQTYKFCCPQHKRRLYPRTPTQKHKHKKVCLQKNPFGGRQIFVWVPTRRSNFDSASDYAKNVHGRRNVATYREIDPVKGAACGIVHHEEQCTGVEV